MPKKTRALRATNTDYVLRSEQLDLPFPPRQPTRRERFEAKVDRSGGPLSCHLWTGSVMQANSYGQFRDVNPATGNDTMRTAHRVAYEMAYGEIPDGMLILHSRVCTSRLCCNPRHLRPGTYADNEADKTPEVRSHRLKPSEALEIALRYRRDGASIEALAKTYKVSTACVRRILTGKTHTKTTQIERVVGKAGRPRKENAA